MKYLILFLLSFNCYSQCVETYNRTDYTHFLSGVREQAIEDNSIYILVDNNPVQYILDEYTGNLLEVGKDEIHLDHIVPLRWAHENGAKCWTNEKRTMFANDPLNTIPVSGSSNRRKYWKLLDFIPSKLAFCEDYYLRIEKVIEKYNLNELSEKFKDHIDRCIDMNIGVRINRHNFP